MFKATTIANEIVRQCHDKGFDVSNLKLQKLLFFVQAYSLAEFDCPVFNQKIEAWEFGPVIPDVYQYFKIYGPNPIPKNHYFSRIDQSEKDNLTDNAKTSVSEILKQLGRLDAFELVKISHEVGSPWHQVYNPNISGTEINNQLIKDYYSV